MSSILSFIVWFAIVFAAAFVGARFLPDEWFKQLKKPTWNPPNRVFAPVWTILYTLLAIAAWLVWDGSGFAIAGVALALFIAQLGFNAAWSWLFFGRHRADLALVDIVILWFLIVGTLSAFWQLNLLAGLLLVPYLLWVSFATILNFSIWRLNKSAQ
ncbi:MAG: tryptophan-rich sensory protein [Chloroflexi bacterium]|nr:tryptophan-rich sensory protein [Chloroflexota bacterium]